MMSKDFFNRTKDVLLETAEELVFGFDYAHPDRVQQKNNQSEPVQEKTAVERAIAERKQQVRAMRSKEEPSRDRGRNR